MKFKIKILFAVFIYPFLFAFLFDGDLRDAINKVRKNEITPEELTAHIHYLASDELGGRFPGTIGDSLTESYLINEFQNYGLTPAGDDGYRERFDYFSETKMGEDNSLAITTNGKEENYKPDIDFRPLGFSAAGSLKSDVVFAGYGITAPELNYDDYKDIDVKGKIVMMLFYSPKGTDPHDNTYSKYERSDYKAQFAKDKGAVGVLFVTGPEGTDEEHLMELRNNPSDIGIPVIQIKRNVADKMLEGSKQTISDIQKNINTTLRTKSFTLNKVFVNASVDLQKVKSKTSNIIGFIEGNDPVLKNEIIVIGAHKDHLGDGMKYGSLNDKNEPMIHNGADDNASGTAGVLEIAEKMAANRKDLKRSYIFMLFSAEEAGLIGSAYFTKSELFKHYNIVSMINMDMIGRLSENKLTVGGTGTSSIWNGVLDSLNKIYNFTAGYQPEGYGPSDHTSFYAKNIPVLFFFTGLHKDYHRPSDDWDKINYDGEKKILEMVYDVLQTIDNRDVRPDYLQAKEQPTQNKTTFKVTVGVIPDYSSTKEGLELLGVKEGGPGEKAGLKAGDVIIKFGSKDIKNIYDYTNVLSDYKPGDETELTVKRGEEILVLKVIFEKK